MRGFILKISTASNMRDFLATPKTILTPFTARKRCLKCIKRKRGNKKPGKRKRIRKRKEKERKRRKRKRKKININK
jgi:hypothetical protein